MKRSLYVRNKRNEPWYLHDITGIVCIGVAVFMLCSLLSYNPYDPTWFYVTTHPTMITNWCGIIGAHVAVLLIYLWGASSLYGIIGLFIIAYSCIITKSYVRNADRIIALYVLMCTSAAWCSAYQIDFFGTHYAGGMIGTWIYQTLCLLLDYVGAILCIYTIFFICILLITRLSLVCCTYYCILAIQNILTQILDTQPHISLFFSRVRKACVEFGNISTLGTKKIKTFFFGKETIDDTYSAYVHENFDKTVYNIEEWHFENPSTSETVLSTAILSQETGNNSKPCLGYINPPLDIFIKKTDEKYDQKYMNELETQAIILQEKLARFGIHGTITSIKRGPVVTLFEYQPTIDSKISKIIALEHDLALALKAVSIRIIAPIPGKSVVGFEVPNNRIKDVLFATGIHSASYTEGNEILPLILGQNTIGEQVVVDLATMPHLLIAGSTGSGKSVALNSMLMSLLCARTPDQLKLILIDPKRLEFAPYADIAHLIFPIVTEARTACHVLRWIVKEMETRYEIMAQVNAKNSTDYNKESTRTPMPYIVVIIDELADLMITAGKEVEILITRIAQMARAAGIHLIVATQRPSVDVITGLIKANFPSRISFRVASKIDSRTILDTGGADILLGRGDMLFLDSRSVLHRIHGAYVSDLEIQSIATYIRSQKNVIYRDLMEEVPLQRSLHEPKDEIYDEVLLFLKGVDEISISLLQRKFRIGYNRSARIIDMLESHGLIIPSDNGKIRKVIK